LPERAEPDCSVAALSERIRAQALAGRPWSLRASELPRLLRLDSAFYHRRIYAAERAGNRLVGPASLGGGFSQDNVGELVSLLELFCGPAAESELRKQGVFFSHPEQLELMGTFLSVAAEAVRDHRLATEQFSAMLRVFHDFERARKVYREEHFPLEGLLARAADRFCAGRTFGLPDLAAGNVRGLLEFFFRKHLLEPERLFVALDELLRQQAVAEGYAERERAHSAAEGQSPVQRARRLLELEGRPLTPAFLKSQYKRLMKIYHPDINPEGLRRCQEINAAYSLLAPGVAG